MLFDEKLETINLYKEHEQQNSRFFNTKYFQFISVPKIQESQIHRITFWNISNL